MEVVREEVWAANIVKSHSGAGMRSVAKMKPVDPRRARVQCFVRRGRREVVGFD